MRRTVGVLLVAVLLAACGDAAPAGSGGGGGGGGGGAGEIPPLSIAWFGSSVDPASFGIVGRFTSVKQGSPVFAVGHLFPAHDPAEVSVTISIGGSVRQTVPLAPGSGGAGDIVAADLSGTGLAPGVYIVSFEDPRHVILASGNLGITAP